MADEIKVAIIEDHKPTRDGLSMLINGSPGFRVVGKLCSVEEMLAKLDWNRPDVVLMDIGLPGLSGIEGTRRLAERSDNPKVLMLTVNADDERVFEAICAGACGYLLKDTPPSKLLEAIEEVIRGGVPMSSDIARKVVTMFREVMGTKTKQYDLSCRELEVLTHLSRGYSYQTTARRLFLSTNTVRFHVRNIYEKLHVHSKSEAVLKAFRAGLIH